jgi:formate dehydrogenase iron-sulfur subunit
MAKAMLNDVTLCIGCRACQIACKQWHDLPAEKTHNTGTFENPPDLSASTWTKIKFGELDDNGTLKWLFSKHQCMHCTEAACVNVCPSGALRRDPYLGFVTYDENRCTGCGYCVEFCPFHIPRMDDHVSKFLGTGKMGGKCDFCYDRVSNGLEPACAKVCPTGAIKFGERDDLVIEGRERVAALKANHPDANLYGEHELGGLHMMYVLDRKPGAYGFPDNPQYPAAATALPIEKWAGIGLGLLAGAGILTASVVARARMVQEEQANGKE